MSYLKHSFRGKKLTRAYLRILFKNLNVLQRLDVHLTSSDIILRYKTKKFIQTPIYIQEVFQFQVDLPANVKR